MAMPRGRSEHVTTTPEEYTWKEYLGIGSALGNFYVVMPLSSDGTENLVRTTFERGGLVEQEALGICNKNGTRRYICPWCNTSTPKQGHDCGQ